MSYIYLCLASDQVEANALAEEYNYGPNSIGVQLQSTIDQTPWVGCHSWVELQVPAVRFGDTVTSLYFEGGTSTDNWNTALADNDLEPIPEVI